MESDDVGEGGVSHLDDVGGHAVHQVDVALAGPVDLLGFEEGLEDGPLERAVVAAPAHDVDRPAAGAEVLQELKPVRLLLGGLPLLVQGESKPGSHASTKVLKASHASGLSSSWPKSKSLWATSGFSRG